MTTSTTTTTTIALFGGTGNVGQQVMTALQAKTTATTGQYKFLVFSRATTTATLSTDDDAADDDKQVVKTMTLPVKKKAGTDDDENEKSLDTLALANMLSKHKVETVFLCIPQLMVHKCKEYIESLLPAWKASGCVKRIVKVGTGNASAYAYGRKHMEGEQVIRDSGFLTLTVLEGGDYSTNPQWLGPAPPGAPYVLIDLFKGLSYLSYIGLKPFRSMGNVPSFFGPTVKQPFLDLRDFGEAIACVLLDPKPHDGKTYRIYSQAVSMTQVADVYSKLLGRKLHVLDMADDEIEILLGMSGMKGEMMELALEMFHRFREGVYEPNDDSWNGFTTITGKQPRTFEDFAKEKVDAGMKPIRFF
jgi:uncharacterized protein YbjT (DUF2867 family)